MSCWGDRIRSMTIKAILHNGSIQPLEPLPPDWAEGKELLVDDPALAGTEDIAAWARELDQATMELPADEHDRFREALSELEGQSKDVVRREVPAGNQSVQLNWRRVADGEH